PRQEGASRCTQQKWADRLLGLGVAYAIYAQQSWPNRKVVVGNLFALGIDGIDAQLLALVASSSGDTPNSDQLSQLNSRAGQVPLFRWGIRLARGLIEHVNRPGRDLMRWWNQLERIEQTMVRSSIWT